MLGLHTDFLYLWIYLWVLLFIFHLFHPSLIYYGIDQSLLPLLLPGCYEDVFEYKKLHSLFNTKNILFLYAGTTLHAFDIKEHWDKAHFWQCQSDKGLETKHLCWICLLLTLTLNLFDDFLLQKSLTILPKTKDVTLFYVIFIIHVKDDMDYENVWGFKLRQLM